MGERIATDVLLIGGGVASFRCARTLRREGFDGRIAVIGEEATDPYNRPPLSKELLREDLPDELVRAEQDGWYERRVRAGEVGDGSPAVDLVTDWSSAISEWVNDFGPKWLGLLLALGLAAVLTATFGLRTRRHE